MYTCGVIFSYSAHLQALGPTLELPARGRGRGARGDDGRGLGSAEGLGWDPHLQGRWREN